MSPQKASGSLTTQLLVSAGVLLLPPLALGAAVVALQTKAEPGDAPRPAAATVQMPADATVGKAFYFSLASVHQEIVEKDTARLIAPTTDAIATSGLSHDAGAAPEAPSPVEQAPDAARRVEEAAAVPDAGEEPAPGAPVATRSAFHALFHHRHRASRNHGRADARLAQRNAKPQDSTFLRGLLDHLSGHQRPAQKS